MKTLEKRVGTVLEDQLDMHRCGSQEDTQAPPSSRRRSAVGKSTWADYSHHRDVIKNSNDNMGVGRVNDICYEEKQLSKIEDMS